MTLLRSLQAIFSASTSWLAKAMSRFWGSGRNGLRQTFNPPAAGSPTLQILAVSPNTVPENTGAGVVVGAVQNLTPGSTLTITDTAGTRFALSGNNILTGATATDYETATSHPITLHEVLAGATNTPRDTIVTINVSDVLEGTDLSAPVLTQTSAATTNPPEWDSDFTGYILWDSGTNSGDKHLMRWRRVNGGAWTTEAEQPLDAEMLTGGFTWPLLEAAKPLAGGYFEAQEQRARYVAGVETKRSAFSNSITDTLAGAAFVPSSLFGAGDVGYAFDTTDGSRIWQNVAGSTPGAFTSVIGKINDISGKGNDLTAQGDNTTRPTWANVNNGLILFDGSNDKLQGVGGFYAKGAMTWIGVVKVAASSRFMWAETNTGTTNPCYAPGLRGSDATHVLNYQRNDVATALATSVLASLMDGNAHIYMVEDTGTQLTIWVDGVQASQTAYARNGATTCNMSAYGNAVVGGADFTSSISGSIGSSCVIGRTLTGAGPATASSEKNSIYNWIATKHGLATI
jgi:hypothetical protein